MKNIFGMRIENHIIKVSFRFKFQKAIKPKRSKIYYKHLRKLSNRKRKSQNNLISNPRKL